MKTMRTTTLALFTLSAAGGLFAQEPAVPAPAAEAPAAPQSEAQKWLAATDAQWQAAFNKGVAEVYDAEMKKLKLQFLNLLEEGINKSSKAGDLNGAVVMRAEQKRFGETEFLPEQDEPAEAAPVKQIRAVIRAQLAKANSDHASRVKAMFAKYDQLLAQTQLQLTQKQRLDDALLVKAKREEVKVAWAVPESVAPPPVKTPTPQPATKTAARPGMADKATLEKGLVGTKWRLPPNKQKPEGASIQFEKNGVLLMNWASARGKWEIQPNGKVVISISAKDPTAQAQITFDQSLQDMHWTGGTHDGKTFHRW